MSGPGARFGLAVPTCTEGMIYPVPYADVDEAVELAVAAEGHGFESVWANDHMTTQRYVRAEFDDPPRFYDPFTYLAFVAACTQTIRLATCIAVLPFRHPAALAKQAATLDLLSGGRFVLGVGIGAYREELEAMWPGLDIHRGKHAEESMEALRLLFTERSVTFEGDYVSFEDIESYPKPHNVPIIPGGNSAGCRYRAAVLGDGWMPAALTPEEVARGLAEIHQIAADHGREIPPDFDVALQVGVAIGDTEQDALATFESSQLFAHLKSLSQSTLKGKQADWGQRNLIGTPDQVLERLDEYRQVGVTTFAGLIFAANTVAETHEAMERFAVDVIRPATSSAA